MITKINTQLTHSKRNVGRCLKVEIRKKMKKIQTPDPHKHALQ